MSAPHFSTDPMVAERFARQAEINVAAAVRFVVYGGFAIGLSEVPTPRLRELGSLPAAARDAYGQRYAAEIAVETRAIQIARGQETVHRDVAIASALKVASDREAAIAKRCAELEATWWSQQRAAWRAQAERELDGDEPPDPEPPAAGARPPRPRRVHDTTSTRKEHVQ